MNKVPAEVSERMRKMGARGGKANAKKHGPKYMRKIGKNGGKKSWKKRLKEADS